MFQLDLRSVSQQSLPADFEGIRTKQVQFLSLLACAGNSDIARVGRYHRRVQGCVRHHDPRHAETDAYLEQHRPYDCEGKYPEGHPHIRIWVDPKPFDGVCNGDAAEQYVREAKEVEMTEWNVANVHCKCDIFQDFKSKQ